MPGTARCAATGQPGAVRAVVRRDAAGGPDIRHRCSGRCLRDRGCLLGVHGRRGFFPAQHAAGRNLMRAALSYLASLVATGLRGLRSRLLLTVGSALLAAIAVAAAVVGPMYQSAGAASYLVTKLRSQPDFLTGLTIDYTPDSPMSSEQAGRRALDAVKPS